MIKLLGNDYRYIFPISFVFALISMIIAFGIRDVRFEESRLARKVPIP